MIGRRRGGVVPSPHQGDAIIGKWFPFPGLRVEGTVPPTAVGALKVADPDLGTFGVDPETPGGQRGEQETVRRLGSPPVVQDGTVRPEPSGHPGQELHPVVPVGPTLDRDRNLPKSLPASQREFPGPEGLSRGVQHPHFALDPVRTGSGTDLRQKGKAILVQQDVRVHPKRDQIGGPQLGIEYDSLRPTVYETQGLDRKPTLTHPPPFGRHLPAELLPEDPGLLQVVARHLELDPVAAKIDGARFVLVTAGSGQRSQVEADPAPERPSLGDGPAGRQTPGHPPLDLQVSRPESGEAQTMGDARNELQLPVGRIEVDAIYGNSHLSEGPGGRRQGDQKAQNRKTAPVHHR